MHTTRRTSSTRRPHIASARSRSTNEPGSVHAGVEQHDPVARRHGPRVAVGYARPRQRQAQAEDARENPFAAAQLAPGTAFDSGAPARRSGDLPSLVFGHRRGAYWARPGGVVLTPMRWVVDGMNVIGSRPDGWWRNRHAAMVRLVNQLECWAARGGEEVAVVFERPPSPPIRSAVVEVACAPRARPNSADDEIVARVSRDPHPQEICVVTSDRALAARVRAGGAVARSAEFLRGQLDAMTERAEPRDSMIERPSLDTPNPYTSSPDRKRGARLVSLRPTTSPSRRNRPRSREMAEENAEQAATRVQEAAANIHQPRRPGSASRGPQRDQRSGDGGAPLLRGDQRPRPRRRRGACGRWAAARTCAARSTSTAPEGVRTFIGDLLEAMPDLQLRDRSAPPPRASAARCSGG